MSEPPERINPFAEEAAVHAAAEALKRLEWEREMARWAAHLEACEVILKAGILPRLELAAAAMRDWGNTAEVTGVARTETHTGTTHLRVKLMLNAQTKGAARLEFIASPKSMIIAVEMERGFEKWQRRKMGLTVEGLSGKCDVFISEFLTWGWVKRDE